MTDLVRIRDMDEGISPDRVVEINLHLDLARILVDFAGQLESECTERREILMDASIALGRVRDWLAIIPGADPE